MDNKDQLASARKTVDAKLGFYIHLLVYVLVNAGLAGINLVTDPSRLWFQWPLIGWGAGLLFHGVMVLSRLKGRSLKDWMIAREMKKMNAGNPQT